MEKIIYELMERVENKVNERYVLAKLKFVKSQNIGKENLKKLIEGFQNRDTINNIKKKIKMSPVSMDWYEKTEFDNFMDFFTRNLKETKLNEIKENSKNTKIIIPNECVIESIGKTSDMSSIIRLKKPTNTVIEDLKQVGVDDTYNFVNMKLYVSYYHNIHSPVSGKIVDLMPISKDLRIFGKNSLWIVKYNTKIGNVFLLLVGESTIQDFDFNIKTNQNVKIGDRIGNFNWGSQTVLLFKGDFEKIKIKKKNHYFFGEHIL
jgi:phosphatidylserine decarboxylase